VGPYRSHLGFFPKSSEISLAAVMGTDKSSEKVTEVAMWRRDGREQHWRGSQPAKYCNHEKNREKEMVN
jgi:hypothetical protein